MLDFGDALGAAGDRAKKVSEGYEYRLPWREMGKRTLALGLLYPYWLPTRSSPFRSVGLFESTYFDPGRWAPAFPNPAFDEATVQDTFWAATIAARIGPDLISAAVDAGEFGEPGASLYLKPQLLARRNKVLRHAFERMAALVDPRIEDGYRLVLTDLEIATNLTPGDRVRYAWRVSWDRTGARDPELAAGEGAEPTVDLRPIVTEVMNSRRAGFVKDPYLTVSVRRVRSRNEVSPRVDVRLRVVGQTVLPVGVYRTVD